MTRMADRSFSCRHTDADSPPTARFSNTSNVSLSRRYGVFQVEQFPQEGVLVKNIVRLVLATLLLLGAVSTASFADGGAPAPMCAPKNCTGK
jgi:hypothetical protein